MKALHCQDAQKGSRIDRSFMDAMGILFLIFIGFCIYSNTFEVPFVFDDWDNIRKSPYLRMTELSLGALENLFNCVNKYRPVSNFSFALNYFFHEYELFGYHLVNIGIHLTTAILIFLFFKITLKVYTKDKCETWRRDQTFLIPYLVAFLWMVLPIHTESVTYVVQRMTSLAVLFYMLSFLLYIKGRIFYLKRQDQSVLSWESCILPALFFAGSFFSGILALASKEMAATLPFFLVLYEWFFFQDLRKPGLKKTIIWSSFAFFVVALVVVLFLGTDPITSILSGYDRRDFSLPQRLMTELRVVVYSISLLFYPHPDRLMLNYDYPLSGAMTNPITTILSLLMIMFLIGFAIWKAKDERLISFSILWFFGNLVIESSFIPLEIIFEHRTYLPSVMLFVGPVYLLFRHMPDRLLAVFLICGCIAGSAMWTYQRNSMWQSEIRVWEDCVSKSPNNARSNFNLGCAYKKEENYATAFSFLQKAITIKPKDAEQLRVMGDLFFCQGDLDKAEEYLKRAVCCDSKNSLANLYLGNVLVASGQSDQAEKYYKRFIDQNPEMFAGYSSMGNLMYSQKRYEDAIPYLLEAHHLQPKDHNVCLSLGNTYFRIQNYSSAREYYEKSLVIEPNDASVYINLGTTMDAMQNYDQAIYYFTKAMELNPKNADVYYNMGVVSSHRRDYNAAILYLEKALALAPDDIKIKYKIDELNHNQRESFDAFSAPSDAQMSKQTETVKEFLSLARMYEKNNEIDQAAVYYQKAIAINPESNAARSQWANFLVKQNKNEQASQQFLKILEIDPDNVDALINSGVGAAIRGQFDIAKDFFKKALAIAPEHPQANRFMGKLLYKQNPTLALSYFEKAIKEDPEDSVSEQYIQKLTRPFKNKK